MEKKIMKYYCNIDVANEVGFEESVMFCNIQFWVEKNKKDKQKYNNHEGEYWTFNSATEFSEQFLFWSPAQIRRILRNLTKHNLIKNNQFNRKGYDKTKWYTLTEKGWNVVGSSSMIAETSKPHDEIIQPIPDDKLRY